jgi:hypothetical protein
MATEWYQQGSWPLVGATAALLFTNVIALWNISRQAQATLKLQLKLKRIEILSQQLSEFYNPLFALILINQRAFTAVGPKSFPEDPVSREAAGEVWSQIKTNLILPNNQRIQEILQTKTHLLVPGDTLAAYIALLNHIAMYAVLQERPTEIYAKFQFPKGILSHVEQVREKLVEELNALKQEQAL